MINKRVRLLLLLSLIVLVFFGYLGLSKTKKEDRNYNQATSNLQQPWLSDDSVYFYTSSFFARYNLKTLQVERLSDYLYMANSPTGLSWSSDGVVFQSSPSSANRDDITTASQQLGVAPYVQHWWRYDFKLKQYQLLYFSDIDRCASLYQIDDENMACIKPGTGGANELGVYNTSNKSYKKLFTSDDSISSLSASGNTLYFVQTSLDNQDTLKSVDTGSGTTSEVYKSDGKISFMLGDNRTILISVARPGTQKPSAVSTETISQKLEKATYRIVFFQDNQKTLDKKVNSLPITLYKDGSSLMISSLDGSVKSVDQNGIKTISKPTKKALDPGDFLFQKDGNIFVLKANGNLLYTGPTSPQRDPSTFNISQGNASSGNSWVDNVENGYRQVFLYLGNVPSSKQQLDVGNNLEKQGFWPSEFNVKWVLDGPDFHAPIKPRAVLIK